MFAISLIAISAVSLLMYYFFNNKKYWDKVALIKGRPRLPLIGNAHQLRTDPLGMLQDILILWKDMDHSTFKIQLGPEVFVALSTPECVEVILKDNTQLDKTADYKFLSPWIGDGLLTSTGEKWKRQRKIITPTFHFKILEQYVNVFNKHGNTFIKLLKNKQGTVINVQPFVTKLALDVICETAMGNDVNAQGGKASEYVNAVHEVCGLITRRMFALWKRNHIIFNLSRDARILKKNLAYLHDFSMKLIKSRREEMKEELEAAASSDYDGISRHIETGTKLYKPFLDLLLLSKLPGGQFLDDQTIRDEVDTFIFEGHDTTTSAISFAVHLLSKNVDVQTKAFEEQIAIFGSDMQRDTSIADLNEMKYLERVIKETLRLYPSVPAIARSLTKDTLLPDGTNIPAGAVAIVFTYSLHRNPKYYTDPDAFEPDRFLGDSMQKLGPFAYVPFSAGPRNCIGQKFAMLELKSILSKILRNFELKDPGPGYDPIVSAELTLKTLNGINLIVTERKH